jgi:hypothetical protein
MNGRGIIIQRGQEIRVEYSIDSDFGGGVARKTWHGRFVHPGSSAIVLGEARLRIFSGDEGPIFVTEAVPGHGVFMGTGAPPWARRKA